MDPIVIILYNFITGTLCLVFGVNLMSGGLERINSNLLRNTIARFTGKVHSAFITGTLITALVQSSAAVTVITVGFVNSGLMKLTQAVGVIYGANVGTTITAQLMAFKVTDLALPIIIAGVVLYILSSKSSLRNIAKAAIGFGLMFLGLGILRSGAPYLRESKLTYQLFMEYGKSPYIGLAIGMITTMLVQSSSATVGLTIVLFNAGLISFSAALGLVLGDNIGTCITAQLASLRTNIYGRRTAWAHTLYNIIGSIIALAFLSPFSGLIRYVTSAIGQDETRLVANAHTIFNVLSAIVFLPITEYYVKFIEWAVPER